jgi:hypothetical protein
MLIKDTISKTIHKTHKLLKLLFQSKACPLPILLHTTDFSKLENGCGGATKKCGHHAPDTRRQTAGESRVVRHQEVVDFQFPTTIRSKVDDSIDPFDYFGPTADPLCTSFTQKSCSIPPNFNFPQSLFQKSVI